MEQAAQQLWDDFRQRESAEMKRKLVIHYLDLVRYVVSKSGLHLQATSRALEPNDLVQYGVIGLIHAIDRFSPAIGVKFETYAIPRIRGAILDEVRKLDWVPRSVRANNRKRERAVDEVVRETGREAVDEEIADKLAMSWDEYQKFIRDSGGPMMSDKREAIENLIEQTPDPFEKLSEAESKAFLVDAVGGLPARERAVIALYYYEGLKFGEIGKILRVSESRVSQIHADVLKGLRMTLSGLH
jgi:RNA polymerase sigma factor for flagellar operon FliA